MFPEVRMRRYRRSESLRRLSAETRLTPDDVILPVFVVPGRNRVEPVPAMPGVERTSVDELPARAGGLLSPAVIVFGVPDEEQKDAAGTGAADPEGTVPRAIRALKRERPELVVITDACLCAYTDHGHCGILTDSGEVDNDSTLEMLGEMARAHAAAGADIVAPSGMMDGMVGAIRTALDDSGHRHVGIMSYAAKFASAFYGPFRDVAHSAPSFGDRRSYQLPPPNRREALRDALLDVEEGADWLMVKPSLPYLDILRELRRETRLPLSAYHVSGEYVMLKHAAEAGGIDERDCVLEALTCIKRAGADAVITYYAEQVCRWLGA